MTDKLKQWLQQPWLLLVGMAVITVVFFVQYSANFDPKLDLNGDNMYYYMLAQSLAEGKGYVNQFGLPATPHQHFPPGYPAFMSVLMRCGVSSTIAMKRANGILLWLSIMLLMWMIGRGKRTDETRIHIYRLVLATSVGLLCSCHAQLLRWATIMMSEMLYLFVVLVLIFLFTSLRTEQIFQKTGWREWVKLVLIFALSCYVWFIRTMGTSIIMALAIAAVLYALYFGVKILINKQKGENEDLALLRKKVYGYLLVAAVVVGGYLVASQSWNARQVRVNPTYTSDYQNDFKKKPNGGTMETTADWTERIENNLQSYTTFYLKDAIFEAEGQPAAKPTAGAWVAGIVLMAIIIIGCIGLPSGGLLTLLYIGVTWAVLLIWPEQYGGIRYFLTLIPLLLVGFANGLICLIDWTISAVQAGRKQETFAFDRHRWWVTTGVVVVLLITLLPRYVEAQEENRKLAKVTSWQKLNNPPMNHYLAAADWCGKNLKNTDLVVCRKPEIYYMYSRYHHATGFPQYASEEEVLQLLTDRHATYILIDSWYRHAYTTLYPVVASHPQQFRLVRQWGEYDPQRGMYPTLLLMVNGDAL